MKILKILSIITTVIILFLMILSLNNVHNHYQIIKEHSPFPMHENKQIMKSLSTIEDITFQNIEDTISDSELYAFQKEIEAEISSIRKEITYLESLRVKDTLSMNSQSSIVAEDPFLYINQWVKIAFSFIFCFAALFVILSNKYEEGKKNWAFSILALIAGIWVGPII